MLSREDFVRLSIEYNLFWLRIMKEHAIFIENALPKPERTMAAEAGRFKVQFENLLASAIRLANGAVSQEALRSGELYTRYTDSAERVTQQFTGIVINRQLTLSETNIVPANPGMPITARKEQDVAALNRRIIPVLNDFIRFKAGLLSSQATCRMQSFMYTALFDHVLREAREYLENLTSIQNRETPPVKISPDDIEFWNRIMSDHSKTMRGQFDPTEAELINTADRFAKLFDALLAADLRPPVEPSPLQATENLREFKARVTRGILECGIKSVMLPLFTDHLLREANHYIRLLRR